MMRPFGPLSVGLESNLVVKKVDEHPSNRTSPSVKGKKDTTRNRATKWMSKSDTGGMGKHFLNTTHIWTSRGNNGDGELSNKLFQFTANGRTEIGHQFRRQGRGDLGGGYSGDQSEANSRDGMVQQEAGNSVEKHFSVDGEQCKVRLSATHGSNMGKDAKFVVAIPGQQLVSRGGTKECMEGASPSVASSNVVRRKPDGYTLGAKDIRSPTHIHLYNGESTLHKDYPSVQANFRIQHPCHGEGDEFGSV